jgi:toxin HigB-1
MILGTRGRFTDEVLAGGAPKGFPPDILRRAQVKLAMIAAAVNVESLSKPPGNMLEKLRGDRSGQYSIRINDQWRICFAWRDGNAHDVEIIDYHD